MKGLTLIELLVALGIFSLVSAVVYSTVIQTLTSRADVTHAMENFERGRSAIDRLSRDLAAHLNTDTYSPDAPLFRAPADDAFALFDRENARLEFTAAVARGYPSPDGVGWQPEGPESRGDQARVAYRLEEGSLVRYELRPPDREPFRYEDASRAEIARGVVELEFRFLSRDEWLESWDSAEPGFQLGRAPTLVELRLVLEDSRGETQEFVAATYVRLGGRHG